MARNAHRLTRVLGIVFLWLAAGVCGMASAQVPDLLNYQGRLTDPGGNPVTTLAPMVFKLYTASSGGAAIYTETQTVIVIGGIFTVAIGAVTPLNLPFDVPYYLGVTVGADAEMTPRQAVLSSPYALNSSNAQALATTATVGGAQITGSINVATLPATQLSGTIGTAQIANNAVTQAKLSPAGGGTAGKVLGTDGTNLVWQSGGALWAQVRSDGALQFHSSGISASRKRTGVYIVTFPQSVLQCALNISATQFVGVGIIGINSNTIDPPNLSNVFLSVYQDISATNTLAIGAYSAGGALIDTPFSIAMTCP